MSNANMSYWDDDDDRFDDADLAQDTDRDPFVMGCDTPGCLMPGPHFLSECHTVEDMEAMEAAANAAGQGAAKPYPALDVADDRCPTCRQRVSRAGEREMDGGSVIVWHCNVPGCSNSADHPNVPVSGVESAAPRRPA